MFQDKTMSILKVKEMQGHANQHLKELQWVI
jgi:hypothetical protein